MVTPYSKNKRTVTVIDTDVPGGTGVGLVAMVEVVALMIGDIVQCYSDERYDDPRNRSTTGMFLRKGQPKSLYRPGSSTDVLLFQRGRIRFAEDLLANQVRQGMCSSRFSRGFRRALVETDLQVRSPVATASTARPEDAMTTSRSWGALAPLFVTGYLLWGFRDTAAGALADSWRPCRPAAWPKAPGRGST